MGRSLEDIPRRLSWMDAAAVLEVEASTPGSPLARALDPEAGRWTLEAQMLRLVEHAVRSIPWAMSGGDESDRPLILPLKPGQDTAGEAVEFDDAVALLGWSLPGADATT